MLYYNRTDRSRQIEHLKRQSETYSQYKSNKELNELLGLNDFVCDLEFKCDNIFTTIRYTGAVDKQVYFHKEVDYFYLIRNLKCLGENSFDCLGNDIRSTEFNRIANKYFKVSGDYSAKDLLTEYIKAICITQIIPNKGE